VPLTLPWSGRPRDRKAESRASRGLFFKGRVTSVTEAGTLTTSYAYDALNDLTNVCQGSAFVNGACPSGGQSRTFAYDSLARLITATNPESGATAYTYDNDGNLLTKTDANTDKTIMTYDALNRVASKAYTFVSGYSTPNVTYCYDGNTQGACIYAPSGRESNLIGHLALVSSSASSTAYGQYSALGNIMQSTQSTGPDSYAFSYTYNLANAMTQMTLPSGRTVTWNYDNANRISSAGGTPPGGAAKSYASSISYAAQGPISQFTLGNGLVEVRSYDTYRQQPIGATLGVNNGDSSRLGLGFGYCASGAYSCTNNNGNLQSQTITLLGATQTYTYDGYNRIYTSTEKTGATTNWSESFNYDSFGNRWVSPNPVGISLSAWTVTADYYNSLTNRLTFNNFGYDNAGNQTTISPYAVSYDVENRQTGFTSTSNGSATYTYDGDGRRVTKTTGGVTTTYVYDAGGNLAAEYSSQPPSMPCQTCYLTTDHLGSTRVITDQNGNPVSRHDFLPFGEELATSNRTAALDYGVADNVMHRYTGQQRDLEGPGLDFFRARYFQGAQGRFTSPDSSPSPRPTPYALRTDPQTLNLYSYLRNNPLAKVDADGHADLGLQLAAWAASRVAESGPKQFLQDVAVGTAKGAASFAVNTVKTAVAIGQGTAGVGTMLTPGPKALEPSNQTQAAASLTTQVALTVASAVVPAAVAGAAPAAAEASGIAVNLGGEGEVAGAINVQGPWALDLNFASSRTGQSLAELQAGGNQFVVASNTSLPFADQSVSTVITNNTPIDVNTWLGPGVQSSEVNRILLGDGQWINNGSVVPKQ
jgi:RHS repeat-associated protein